MLVTKCMDAKGVGCESWESEIDERVAALYGIEPAARTASMLIKNAAI